jgi:hypothetical protein
MVPFGNARHYSPQSETIAVIVANVLPLVGVVVFGWDLAALVFLYWFELGILSFWALVKALFAGRPSEFDADPLIGGALARKRTAIPVPFTDLGVRLSTLPVLAVGIPILTLVWFFAGVTTVGVVGAETPDSDTLVLVTLSAFGIFLSEGAATLLKYFYQQGYRDHSAQTAIQGVFMRAVVIAIGGLLTATFVGLAANSVSSDEPITAIEPTVIGLPILVGIILVKFSFDLGSLYRERLVAFDEASYFELGWAYEPPSRESIDPVRAVDERVRPALLGRLVGGISAANARRHPGALGIGGFLLLVSLLFMTGRTWDIALVFVGASLAVPMVVLTIDHGLRHGAVEYRISEEAIVAYDRLFQTRLWRIEPWDENGLRVERGRLHRWIDTSTVVIECSDRELRLPHLRHPEPILDVFDRRVTGI